MGTTNEFAIQCIVYLHQGQVQYKAKGIVLLLTMMGEQECPENSHLRIFMSALMTDAVSVCQVKAYHTELAATCLCMALIETHDPKYTSQSYICFCPFL